MTVPAPPLQAPLLSALLAVDHLGRLHAHERLLVAVVAVGPFVVLAVVVHLVRRRDLAAEREEEPAGRPSSDR